MAHPTQTGSGRSAVADWWFIAFAVAKDIFLTSSGKAGNVATWAHLGGYAFGIATSLILLAS
ncbi:MAG: rhomboid family intramembrane serine protease, partial [Rhodospirillales bacterium]